MKQELVDVLPLFLSGVTMVVGVATLVALAFGWI